MVSLALAFAATTGSNFNGTAGWQQFFNRKTLAARFLFHFSFPPFLLIEEDGNLGVSSMP